MASRSPYSVYVGNLPKYALERDIDTIFHGCSIVDGSILKVNPAADKRGGRGGRGNSDMKGRGTVGNGWQSFGGNRGFDASNFEVGGRGSYSGNIQRGFSGGRGRSGNFAGMCGNRFDGNTRGGTSENVVQCDPEARAVFKLKKVERNPTSLSDERELSERSKAIFGCGRPREASPIREQRTRSRF
ncbi:unnamed protein product [Protopolystoma xenopodis]|uniref:RRM domain-containing protein n=1 Tax=Protopolystoma xenopodis TaxID=117903 RepID=A0A3S5BD50_9PLAT|nr:unnamed protein product [Protopolystoma xenopodis]